MDKRSESRVPRNVRFFVHVHACNEDPDLVGVSLECEAVDFSLHGLQLKTDEAVPVGSLLNITIGIGDPFAMYLLRGEVRWRRPNRELQAMGIMLHHEDETDFDAWGESFDDIFAA